MRHESLKVFLVKLFGVAGARGQNKQKDERTKIYGLILKRTLWAQHCLEVLVLEANLLIEGKLKKFTQLKALHTRFKYETAILSASNLEYGKQARLIS